MIGKDVLQKLQKELIIKEKNKLYTIKMENFYSSKVTIRKWKESYIWKKRFEIYLSEIISVEKI